MNLFVGYEYMTWNYRVVKYSDGSGYGLHEIYYDDDGVEIRDLVKSCRNRTSEHWVICYGIVPN